MLDANPNQVQHWKHSRAALISKTPPTPLVLIHDGSGTTFGYFSLGELNRDVYAIHNPHFESGEPWAGGINEMAKTYIQLLKDAGISGRILLGGWSLGGYLSIEMTRLLQQEAGSTITIAGLLIIDSPRHVQWKGTDKHFVKADIAALPPLVQNCFDQCDEQLEGWEFPVWHFDGDAAASPEATTPPPAVLLRCKQRVPVKGPAGSSVKVDAFRDQPKLGWEDKYPHFIQAVVQVNAHHFNLFDFKKTTTTTKNINEGLKILDRKAK